MADASKRKLNWPRRIVQTFSLAILGEFALYGVVRCPFAVPYVSCGNCPVVQCPGRQLWIPVWILILVSGLLFGRGFCGWACPAGFVSDLLGRLAFLKRKITGTADRILSAGRYLLLVTSLFVYFDSNNPRWAIPIRTGEFLNSIALTVQHANNLWLWRTLAILAALALGVAVSHFWCRYLCPTGGILEMFNGFAPVRYRKTSACDDCQLCRRVCPTETRPAETNCNNCGDCVPACPADAIRLRLAPTSHTAPQKPAAGADSPPNTPAPP